MWRTFRESQTGQALVEFVLALPLLLILFLGCVELIHLGMAHIMVRHAVMQAGRQAQLSDYRTPSAVQVAQTICRTISSGETSFQIEPNQDQQMHYTVTHIKKSVLPFFPDQTIKHSLPVLVFDTKN